MIHLMCNTHKMKYYIIHPSINTVVPNLIWGTFTIIQFIITAIDFFLFIILSALIVIIMIAPWTQVWCGNSGPWNSGGQIPVSDTESVNVCCQKVLQDNAESGSPTAMNIACGLGNLTRQHHAVEMLPLGTRGEQIRAQPQISLRIECLVLRKAPVCWASRRQ